MTQIEVILTWSATGQVCDLDGKRVENGNIVAGTFDSLKAAQEYCTQVFSRRPFICSTIRYADGTHIEDMFARTDWHAPYRIKGSGRYCVLLTEWMSRACVNEDCDYVPANAQRPLVDFETYRQAKRYSTTIAAKHARIVPWIFGPGGNIMFCDSREVTTDEVGNRLVYLSCYDSLQRRLSMLGG